MDRSPLARSRPTSRQSSHHDDARQRRLQGLGPTRQTDGPRESTDRFAPGRSSHVATHTPDRPLRATANRNRSRGTAGAHDRICPAAGPERTSPMATTGWRSPWACGHRFATLGIARSRGHARPDAGDVDGRCVGSTAALRVVASSLHFSEKLVWRCAVGARGGLSLTASG